MTVPLTRSFQVVLSSMTALGNYSTPVVVAPWAATVTQVQYIPASTLANTGASSAPRTFSLYNRLGSASAGTGTVILARGNFTSSASSITAFSPSGFLDNVASTLPLNAVTASLTVAAGDILEWETSQSSTASADPGGMVVVFLSRI